MKRPSRRKLLGVSASALAASLSGCLDAFANYLGSEEEGEVVVALTNLRRPSGASGGAGTPADIAARVDVENRRAERVSAQLEMELRYVPEGETEQRWTKRDNLEIRGSISPQNQYIFADAYQSGSTVPDDYEFDAKVVDVEVVEF